MRRRLGEGMQFTWLCDRGCTENIFHVNRWTRSLFPQYAEALVSCSRMAYDGALVQRLYKAAEQGLQRKWTQTELEAL
jgi:hypothetical protein